MKHTILFLFTFFSFHSIGQNTFQDHFRQIQHPLAKRAYMNPQKGTLKFIEFKDDVVITTKNLNEKLEGFLSLKPDQTLRHYLSESDLIGWNHHRYYNYYKDIQLAHDMFIFHEKNGKILHANGELSSWLSESNHIPSISLEDANRIAGAESRELGAIRDSILESPVTLAWLVINNKLTLCYKVDVYAPNIVYHQVKYVNAHSGEIERSEERVLQASVPGTAHTRYYGQRTITVDSLDVDRYRLIDTTRGDGIVTSVRVPGSSFQVFEDDDNIWDDTSHMNDAALDAHFGMAATYDYFYDNFGRDSYDNQGKLIRNRVHETLLIWPPYQGEFAAFDGNYFLYGDGGGPRGPYTSVDIVGHEFTHGVVINSSQLLFEKESGALHESFCDIFGTIIKFQVDPLHANYEFGAKIWDIKRGFRDISEPNAYNQPDCYLGDYWFTNSYDNYGVHINSGVQNYWFYLLSEGGVGANDFGYAYNVDSLGMEAVGQIAYRNLAYYLSMQSNFFDAAFYSLQATLDIFGHCSPEESTVAEAWRAVGIDTPAGYGTYANIGWDFVNSACSAPFEVNFLNQSFSYHLAEWDLGDGTQSTQDNPSHTYQDLGSYDLRLIVHDTICMDSDTLFMPNGMVIDDSTGPAPCNCGPISVERFSECHITDLIIQNDTLSSFGKFSNYEDFTCENKFVFTEFLTYPIEAIMSEYPSPRHVSIWIDFDNSNSFEANEQVYFDDWSSDPSNFFDLYIPEGVVYDEFLRMRILHDFHRDSVISPCSLIHAGQVLDYSAKILKNVYPPIPNFTVLKDTLIINELGKLFEDCSNNVDSFEWSSEHAVFTSTSGPITQLKFDSAGVYNVSLKVSNQFGSDSITKNAIITVLDEVMLCGGVDTLTSNSVFHDPGGPGFYQNDQDCELVIDIPCATGIRLTSDVKISLSTGDKVEIFAGEGSNETKLFSHQSTGPKTLNEGHEFIGMPLRIKFVSNGFNIAQGFRMPFEAIEYPHPFSPSIDLPNQVELFGEVNPSIALNQANSSFFNEENTSILWDFGDGSPLIAGGLTQTHSYSNLGDYQIKIHLSNCDKDTVIEKNINVYRNGSPYWNKVDVYPNPTEGKFSIEEKGMTKASLFQITDPIGRLVHEYIPEDEHPIHQFDLSHLAQGTYHLKIFYPKWSPVVMEIIISK